MPGAGVTPFLDWARRSMRIRNVYAREAIAEMLGTAILVFFGVGGGIQHSFNSHYADLAGTPRPDSMQPIFGSLFGLMAAILIVGGSSGGHINPAVTLGLCITGNCSWIKLPLFWVAQFLGAYIGCGLACANYAWIAIRAGLPVREVLDPNAIAPVLETPLGSAFLDQILGTSILVMLIVACCDQRNMQVPKALIGFFICLTICALAMCFGVNAGAVLNPARDFGARIMALTIGYTADDIMIVKVPNSGGTGFVDRQWWTVGFFGPLIGGALGALLYVLLIGAHLKDENEKEEQLVQDSHPEDWRSTRFMSSKSGQQQNAYSPPPPPPPQQQQHNPHAHQYSGGSNNYGYGGGPGQNTGYMREDMRNRGGY